MTAATDRRRPLFTDFETARAAIACLRQCDRVEDTETLAFVLMPDHLHWLLALQAASLSGVVRRFKSTSARAICCPAAIDGQRIWQPGYHDHALRRDDDVLGAARYVIANPVRAGLTTSVRDYPHWDARWV